MAVTPKEVALAIVPKVTGGLSMLGSGYIAYEVLSNPQKRVKTYHRLVAVMSLIDFVSSFCYFLSTWPMPPGENKGWMSPEHYLAAGNAATCTAQGFGIQWGVTTAFFNVVLSLHYLLVIRFKFTEKSIQKIEFLLLGIPLAVGLGLCLPGLFLQTYANSNLWCWIANRWDVCTAEGLTREECIVRTSRRRWAFYFYPIWSCLALIALGQIWLWWTVRQMDVRVSQFRSNDVRKIRTKQSQRVAVQAGWYVAGFIVTWVPYTALALTNLITKKFFNPHDPVGFAVLLMVVICQPIQGFINLFIYHRRSIVQSTTKMANKVSQSLRMSRSPADDNSHRCATNSVFQKTVRALEEETVSTRPISQVTKNHELERTPADYEDELQRTSIDVDEYLAKTQVDQPEQASPNRTVNFPKNDDDDSDRESFQAPTPPSQSAVRFEDTVVGRDSWAELGFEDEHDDWGMTDLEEIYG